MQLSRDAVIFAEVSNFFSFREIQETSGSLFSDQLLVTSSGLLLLGQLREAFVSHQVAMHGLP